MLIENQPHDKIERAEPESFCKGGGEVTRGRSVHTVLYIMPAETIIQHEVFTARVLKV